jgi:ferredoxin-NADP reductase
MEAGTRLNWQPAMVVMFRDETPTVRSITFDVPAWMGHSAGQHVDIRLTAENGYQAERSYSIASAAGQDTRIELTVERLTNGEVSPFLTQELVIGDSIELRGPIGGYFNWKPGHSAPLMLIGGGSGVVPLMSMLRTRYQVGSRVPARLLYSSQTLEDIIYRQELDSLVAKGDGLSIVHTITRGAPAGWQGETRRVDRDMLAAHVFSTAAEPLIFVCGPTSFVEVVADQLVVLGHEESAIRTERFGPTGASPSGVAYDEIHDLPR